MHGATIKTCGFKYVWNTMWHCFIVEGLWDSLTGTVTHIHTYSAINQVQVLRKAVPGAVEFYVLSRSTSGRFCLNLWNLFYFMSVIPWLVKSKPTTPLDILQFCRSICVTVCSFCFCEECFAKVENLFISSSTCFGQLCAHPQELTTQWFYRRVWCSAVAAVGCQNRLAGCVSIE